MKLIVLDCDGVISKGEGQPFNLTVLDWLAALNRQAKRGDDVPAVTLNTGRPSPYVEAVMQMIDGWQPALYENGAGLYFPESYQFKQTPLLTTESRLALQTVISRVDQAIVQSQRAYWQPGKSICYSLFAHPPYTLADFIDEVEAIVAQVSAEFVVTPASLALNIHPPNIHKGTGLEWLAKVTDINPAEMAGAGDSAGDIDFLQLIGHPAAPANATAEVKAVVDYISPKDDALGLADILDYWLE